MAHVSEHHEVSLAFSPRTKATLAEGTHKEVAAASSPSHPPHQHHGHHHAAGHHVDVCEGCGKELEEGKTAVIVKALGKKWHKQCLACGKCKNRIAESFNSQNGVPYCDACFNQIAANKCPKCQQAVSGAFVKALGKEWHKGCFVCAGCGKPFTDHKFEVDEKGNPFHEKC